MGWRVVRSSSSHSSPSSALACSRQTFSATPTPLLSELLRLNLEQEVPQALDGFGRVLAERVELARQLRVEVRAMSVSRRIRRATTAWIDSSWRSSASRCRSSSCAVMS